MQEQAPWLIANRYEVGQVVGRGGYGMVCRGFDRVEGRPVALKMLSPEAGRDPDVVERMLREQQALVALSGTCAVTAIDLCRLDSGAPCLVMEWLDGRDLEQELSDWESRGEVGRVEGLLRALDPLTQTLGRAHDLGLVHRDIKPANIFVTSGPEPGTRLLDFGLSRMKSAAPLTQLGMVMGSPSYIAPETWRGNSSALDGRADLFSLAVIVFRWLTGKLPFDAPDLIGKMTAVTTGPRPSVVTLRPELAAALDGWMARALAVEPDARFQSAREFYVAFAAAVEGRELGTAADISGLRPRLDAAAAAGSEPDEGPLVGAWRRAAALLKRFTGPRDLPVSAAPAGAAATRGPSSPPPRPPSAVPPPVSAVPPPMSAVPPPVSAVPPPVSAVPPPMSAVPPPMSAVPPPVSVPPPQSSQRPSVWLDSSELEDAVESVRAPAQAPPGSEETAPAPALQPKVKKGKGAGKSKPRGPKETKSGKSKAKGAGKKSRNKKRKA